jgi:PAS domain S-box-containing protein
VETGVEDDKKREIVGDMQTVQLKNSLPQQFTGVIKVLLIEDNRAYAEVIGRILDRSQDIRFDLKKASRLADGLEYVGSDEIDIILLDLKLPDSQGIMTFEKLYACSQKVPIIVLTAIDNDELALAAVQKGAQDYLLKDQVNSRSLIRAIRYAVERKRMEEIFLNAAHEWRTTFDAIGDVVCLIDSERNIIRCNKAMTELLQMPFISIIKKNCCQLIHSVSKPVDGCPFETMKRTHRREEIILQRRNKWLRISIDPLVDEKNNLVGGVHIITDITKDKEIDRMKSELIANVSHELRTPLSTIKEGIALLDEGALGPFYLDQKDMLSRIKKNTDRLGRLIDALLDMSQIEAGRMVMKKSLVDVHQLIKKVLFSFNDQAKTKNIKLAIMDAKAMPPLYIDPDRISQVLRNLIANSLKFTPENGRITVGIKDGEKEAEISVSDTGIGISSKNVLGLFDKFSQYDRDYKPGEQGTGLGLPIAKEIIEMHGGRIWVESEYGKGSTFAFALPRLRQEETCP